MSPAFLFFLPVFTQNEHRPSSQSIEANFLILRVLIEDRGLTQPI